MEHIRIIATSECKVLHLAFIHTHIYKSLIFYIPCFITLNNYSMYCYSQVQKCSFRIKINNKKNCRCYGGKGVKEGHLLTPRKVGVQDLDMLLFSCPPFLLLLLPSFKSAPFKLPLKKQKFSIQYNQARVCTQALLLIRLATDKHVFSSCLVWLNMFLLVFTVIDE